ncbi:MAG: hypothetical protein CMJ78_11400 [Planctomycetaceae bacterium]|nr:hypothetical protein [Planctomycetaceae bacterium]
MNFRKLAQTMMIVALSVSIADAQDQERRQGGQRQGGRTGFAIGGGGMRPGGGIGKLTLLQAEPIQKELKLGKEQLEIISESLTEYREKQRGLVDFSKFRELSQEEREKLLADWREKRTKLASETEDVVLLLLDDKQATRLTEITVQLNGIQALLMASVAKELKIGDEQKKKIEGVFKAQGEKMRKAFEEMRNANRGNDGNQGNRQRFDFDKVRKMMEESRKETETKTLALLSDDQKNQFEKMKGKKFEVDRRALFSRGRSRGTGGQRRPGEGRSGAGEGRPNRPDGERPARPE